MLSPHLGRVRVRPPLADDAYGVGPTHPDGGDARQLRSVPRVIDLVEATVGAEYGDATIFGEGS